MFLRNKKKIFWGAIAITVALIVLLVWFSHVSAPGSETSKTNTPITKTVQIGGVAIRAELATTPAEQTQGLSGRTSLTSGTGMLFVFGHPSNWGIWMKDMNFPIDVLWITDDFKISDIVENMSPASYPTDYMPHMPVRYVLEIPAGTVKKYGIVVGQSIIMK